MKYVLTLIVSLSCLPLFSQEVNSEIFDEIYESGKKYIAPIKSGQIEFLKKINPPKDTWLYTSLEKYQQHLGSKDILYGSIIMPSTLKESNIYSYISFAYNTKKEFYYFAGMVSFEVIGDSIRFDNSYLFTERKPLMDWWMSIASFYKSDNTNGVPEKYIFEICPPPPFKE